MAKIKNLTPQVVSRLAGNLEASLRDLRRCGTHRSHKATLVEMGIQLSGFKNDLADKQKFAAMLANAEIENTYPIEQLPVPMSVEVCRLNRPRGVTYLLNHHNEAQKTIIYLTGGAFIQRPDKTHWQYLDRLATATGAQIYVPIYPLVPQSNYQEAYQLIADLYNEVYTKSPVSQISLMGDSAGGGLAAGFCELLGQTGLPQPGHLILFSPWLDLDLTNPLIDKYAANDVTLAVDGLREIGRLWAGNTSHHDFRLSPLYGQVRYLRDVTIFAGTKEIMCPDINQFVQRLRAAGVSISLGLGRELFHIYPLYPIPEAKSVMEQVCEIINQ